MQKNAAALAANFTRLGLKVATGGTDNHLLLLDIRASHGLTGRQGETALVEAGVTLNRNSLPFDPNGPWWTSGLRLGTAAVTSLGMGEPEMKEIALIVKDVLDAAKPGLTKEGVSAKGKIIMDEGVKTGAQKRVKQLLGRFVLYHELDLDFLKESFS